MKSHKRNHLHKLLAATLAVGSTLQMVSPVWADGVAAGTDIKNTATATFKDGTKDPVTGQDVIYNATSNEVVITVAEVAGITITEQPPSVTNPNSNDTLHVDFVITNTGNDPTQFVIPGTANLSNTTKFQQNGDIQIVAVNGNNLAETQFVPIPQAGTTETGTLTIPNLINGSIPANGSITVRVPIKVLTGAIAGDTLTVSLGNTSTPNQDNQDRSTDVDTNDVYTKDNANNVGGETNTTAPLNGVREAMATSSTITVNARQQAFPTVLKAVSNYTKGTDANDLADDVLTYGLALRVENPTNVPAGLVVSDLHGTEIKINNTLTPNRVLVSDAIPAGMKLNTTVAPTAPANWTVVYTTDDLTIEAHKANWTTSSAGNVKRVGFIYDATTTPLAKGTTISGFSFSVTPDTPTFKGGQVANIAQVFGQSQPGPTVADTSTQLVYDESGDQTPNNGLNGTNPDSTVTPPANGGISNGVADATKGDDPGTYEQTNAATQNPTNAATNKGDTNDLTGENTVFIIAATPLNGPIGQPGAVGPTNNNDDFTNKSIVVDANKNPADTLTDAETTAVKFENTAQNTSGGTQVITLLPTPPATPGDLLDGTKVTITDPATNTSATYTYTAANGFTADTGTTTPVKLTIPAGGTANYTVTVDLPAAPQLKGFPVPITAFVDTNGDGLPANEPANTTIDRVYTNYLKLEKKARMLEADGTTPVAGAAGTFTTVQADLSAAAKPGRIIEYQITYTNISSTGGTNNVILPANELIITENGSTGSNTWFTTTLDSQPAQANGSAIGTSVSVTRATNGTVTNDIQEYKDTINTVAPQGTGTFTFQRKIKDTGSTN